jgi:alpha-glucosidase
LIVLLPVEIAAAAAVERLSSPDGAVVVRVETKDHLHRRADYIAEASGTRSFPWRVLAIAEHDRDLLENEIVFKLAPSQQLDDTAWIKPGKVAWDWWNANNLHGVDFRAGINTATYRHYIAFAARSGIEYVILDEGWYELGNLMAVNPEINMEELFA